MHQRPEFKIKLCSCSMNILFYKNTSHYGVF